MPRWNQLVTLSEEQLASHDIAELNLACAEGLPGSEKIDVALCRNRLDEYARRVREYTEPRMTIFHRKPQDYNNSEGYFRMLVMITVLQRDLGVRYNPAKIPEDAPFGPEDIFIHGIIQGEGGTCNSMPVVYIAVGRRLGYPLKLMSAYRHLFVRWDDPKGERFNIEGSGHGMKIEPDEYFRAGRMEVLPEVEKACCYLRPMTRREELGAFLKARAIYLREIGSYRRAMGAYAWAAAIAPQNESYRAFLSMNLDEWQEKLQKLQPPGFPALFFHWGERRFPEAVPESLERNLLYCEALENVLNDPAFDSDWWQPLRKGEKPRRQPARMDIRFLPSGGCNISVRFEDACVPIPKPIRAGVIDGREWLRKRPEWIHSAAFRALAGL